MSLSEPYLIDSHCHLDFPEFQEDIEGVIDRAHAAGVEGMVTICTHASKFRTIADIAERFAHKNVWCSIGTHPHHAAEESEAGITAEEIIRLARTSNRLVGLGECGLDYYYDNSPREDQRKSFAMQLEVSKELDLPVLIHTRDAEKDTIRILKNAGAGTANGPKGLLHCFSGSRQLAEAALELGFHISFSGIITFNKSEDLRETAKMVPSDRLLVETDAPFLAPVPKRGKTNEPAYTAHTAKCLAEIKEMTPAELASITTANFMKLFDRARTAQ